MKILLVEDQPDLGTGIPQMSGAELCHHPSTKPNRSRQHFYGATAAATSDRQETLVAWKSAGLIGATVRINFWGFLSIL
jgi:hypothetical protein